MLKLVICTTVPETLHTILRGQPAFLHQWFDVHLVTSSGDAVQMIGEKEGVHTHVVDMSRGISPFKDVISIIKMIRFLLRCKPEIVHSYTPKAGLVMMLAAWFCRVPIRIHTFTGLIFPTSIGFRKKILMFVDKIICFCATVVVPEGAGVARELRLARITTKPLDIIGHGNIAGVDTDYVNRDLPDLMIAAKDLRLKIGLDDRNFVFCFIGRLNKDKGLVELVTAFSDLPDNSHLLVVGDLDLTAPIDSTTQHSLLINSRIHTIGFMDDIRPALAVSDVFVLPSYREGFPNVLLESAAMECPAIATDINGCNEFIEHQVNGWLVRPRDSDDLAMAMEYAMTLDKKELRKMGKLCRKKVQENFERSEHWVRMKGFYESQVDNIDS